MEKKHKNNIFSCKVYAYFLQAEIKQKQCLNMQKVIYENELNDRTIAAFLRNLAMTYQNMGNLGESATMQNHAMRY